MFLRRNSGSGCQNGRMVRDRSERDARGESRVGVVSGSADGGIEVPKSVASADDPWVFFPTGLDWAWVSIRRARALVDEAQRKLAVIRGVTPSVWSYRTRPDPGTLVVDLALQGLSPCCVRAGTTPGKLEDVRLENAGEEPESHDVNRCAVEVPLADPDAITSGWPWARSAVSPVSNFDVGWRTQPLGAAASDIAFFGEPGGGESWGPVSRAELSKTAAHYPAGTDREVLVFSAGLGRLVDRLAFSWMLASGAAAVVVRESEVAAATAWAHPTAMWLGTDAEERLEKVLTFAGGSSLRSRRRVVNRTRRVFLVESSASAALQALSRDLSLELIEVAISH